MKTIFINKIIKTFVLVVFTLFLFLASYNTVKAEEDFILFSGEGDLSLGEYKDVVKIVNITDKSYRLSEEEYIFDEGLLVIVDDYLCSLKCDEIYLFRVVTSDEFIDINIKTNFTGSTLNKDKSDYTTKDDVIITLEGANEIKEVYLDGVVFTDYTVSSNEICISQETLLSLTNGMHEIIVYTEVGRPSISINIVEAFDYVEEVEEANHIFFYVDISIFAAFILGYVVFSIVKKRKEGESNE